MEHPGPLNKRRKRSPQASGTLDSGRSVHNELEKRRRAQLKRCLEELKQQMPLGADCARYTTLSLLRWARMHIQRAGFHSLTLPSFKASGSEPSTLIPFWRVVPEARRGEGQRKSVTYLPRALPLPGLSSAPPGGQEWEEAEVDVESLVFGGEAELLRGFGAGQEHSYSHSRTTWL
ncbi:Hypothetical predicted protein [Lynx pardinus]|uniref:Max dimerization protein 3 n=1 Tax=Lynx pardinus TaxID=191816 RepID=A0A485N3P3_LYNPA|nr:Hypothetical predicted protein [Lynx pardinus]